MIEIRYVMEHVEVFKNGVFQFSEDTYEEAYDELNED
jgi:hypothetical protein